MVIFFVAAWTPTDKSRQLAVDIFAALDARYSRKEAAELLGVSEKLLSDWAQCKKPLNWFRFADLDDAFWTALQTRMAQRSGGIYIEASVVTLLRGAAALKRAPLKALLGSDAERRLA